MTPLPVLMNDLLCPDMSARYRPAHIQWRTELRALDIRCQTLHMRRIRSAADLSIQFFASVSACYMNRKVVQYRPRVLESCGQYFQVSQYLLRGRIVDTETSCRFRYRQFFQRKMF